MGPTNLPVLYHGYIGNKGQAQAVLSRLPRQQWSGSCPNYDTFEPPTPYLFLL